MFTGLIEEIGVVIKIVAASHAARIQIAAETVLEGTRIGHSIAVNGACLTVVELGKNYFIAEAMAETLNSTTLGTLRPRDRVNLERALRLGDRLGGHLVSGHVDGVGVIRRRERIGPALELTIEGPAALAPYIARKGSIAVDGTSLTVIDVEESTFRVGIVPHTLKQTILGEKNTGAEVNLEVDILSRYLERLLNKTKTGPAQEPSITVDFLAAHGFV
ncbi:MAG: riboflavin synthase [Clostridia bacterium]|nr:riboflavin synthase [Clostridia bacterium]